MRAYETLEVGGVLINKVPTFRVENMPYGGIEGQRVRSRRRAFCDGGNDGAQITDSKHQLGGTIHENRSHVYQWEMETRRGGETREILNPANNEVIGIVADGTEQDAELAIHAARAFDEGPWPQMRAPERASDLFKLADLIDANAEAFRRTRNAQQRQAAARGKIRRGRRGGVFPLLRGADHQAARPDLRGRRPDHPGDGRARADRRVRADHPVELSAAHGRVETRARPRRRQLLHPQARRDDAAHRDRVVRAHRRGRLSARQRATLLGPGPTVGHALAASMLVDKIAFTGGTVTGRKIMAGRHRQHQKGDARTRRQSRRASSLPTPISTWRWSMRCSRIFAGQGEVCSAGSRLILDRKDRRQISPAARGSERQDRRRRRPRSEDRDGPAHHAARTWSACSATSRRAARGRATCSAAGNA